MSPRWVNSEQRPSVGRDRPVVCLLATGADPLASLRTVVACTAEHVPILLAGPFAEQLDQLARAVSRRELWLLAAAGSLLCAIAAATAPADIALLSRACRVGPDWLERLAAAALSDTTIVTATALANHAGALSLSAEPAGAGASAEPPGASEAVAQHSLRAYPRIVRAGAHCVYVRRRAIELLGGFDLAGDDHDAAIGAFSRRCLERGMVHVAADDVFVTCEPPRAPPEPDESERDDYEDDRSTLKRALRVAGLAISERLTVTLDARALGPVIGGTQVYIVELALGLARSGHAAVRLVIVPEHLTRELGSVLRREPNIELISYDEAVSGAPRTHVVHRPQQVFSEHDLALLRLLGERIVVTHQDLIAYRNPTYHASVDDWRQYRRVTRIALAVADKVVFFSEHARSDALAEGLVEARHAELVGIGSDQLWRPDGQRRPPDGALAKDGFLLCLGADYQHKNRPFAIALAGQLRAAHGWQGKLVLAGPHVAHGSSRAQERALLARDPDLAEAVLDIGPVDEAGKAWLYGHAAAVLFPSLYEGFGLIPFEAARARVPCLFAAQAALSDVAGSELATLRAWDLRASAAAVAPLLRLGRERASHVQGLVAAARASRWDVVAPRMLGAYERAIRAPQRAATHYRWQELERERYIRQLADRVEAYAEVGDAMMLVVRDGWLDDSTRQGLMRVASRPAARRLALWPFKLAGGMRRPARGESRQG